MAAERRTKVKILFKAIVKVKLDKKLSSEPDYERWYSFAPIQ